METVQVALGERSYPLHIGPHLLQRRELLAPHLGSGRAVVVTNDTVAPLYGEPTRQLLGDRYADQIVLPDGEQHKHLDTVARIYDHLLQGHHDRNTTLVALGGGVIGDITGFAAATYQRGIRFVQIPTTLLAQVDSSVGGKTGVNHPLGKNMIGAFYQPVCVLADTSVLHTLPPRQVKAGLAEVLKYGLLGDADFFAWLERNAEAILALTAAELTRVIRLCCEMKAAVVASDEREHGSRALLNLGHTFGHAIEAATGYGSVLHGEAVAMGIVMAADLSCRIGWLEPAMARRVRHVIEQVFGMPAVPPAGITAPRYLELMAADKKAQQGRIRFILLRAIGAASITTEVEPALLEATLHAGDNLCR